jgi:hypothetical protein
MRRSGKQRKRSLAAPDRRQSPQAARYLEGTRRLPARLHAGQGQAAVGGSSTDRGRIISDYAETPFGRIGTTF